MLINDLEYLEVTKSSEEISGGSVVIKIKDCIDLDLCDLNDNDIFLFTSIAGGEQSQIKLVTTSTGTAVVAVSSNGNGHAVASATVR